MANGMDLPTCGWLILLEHGVLVTASEHPAVAWWSEHSAVFSDLNTQSGLVIPCIAPILLPLPLSLPFISLFHWAGSKAEFHHKAVHFIHMILKVYSERSITISLPESSLSLVPQSCSSHVFDKLAKKLSSDPELTISSFSQSEHQNILVKILPTERTSLL